MSPQVTPRMPEEHVEEITLTDQEISTLKRILEKGGVAHEGKVKAWVSNLFTNVDYVLDKFTRAWLYILELLGFGYVLYLITQFKYGLDLYKAATTPELRLAAKEYVQVVKTAAESTNGIIVGLCIAIPSVIAAMRTVRKFVKGGSSILDGTDRAGTDTVGAP